MAKQIAGWSSKSWVMLLVVTLIAGIASVGGWASGTAHAGTQNTYYVSPSGNDSNPGTLASPFKTIGKARNVVRTKNGNMTGDIIVYLRAGDYYLDNTLTFDETDSGTNGYQVIYKNYDALGSARIIGGEPLSGWTLKSGSSTIYQTSVGIGWEFDTLYENGVRGVMARYPNSGYNKIDHADSAQPKKAFFYKNGNIPAMADISNLQVYVFPGARNWANEILPVAAINRSNRKITLSQNQRWPYLGDLSANSRYFIQGAIELLDQPGEFYLDKAAGILYYYPRDPSINSQQIMAPKVDKVLFVKGSSQSTPAHHITFDGLTVMVSNFTYVTMNKFKTGNIVLMNADNITIANCRIVNSASTGVTMPSTDLQDPAVQVEAKNNVITGNYFSDIGSTGVEILGTGNTNVYTHYGHTVSNNYFDGIARTNTNGAAIQLNGAGNNLVSHNKIVNTIHYGIESKGSKWTDMPAVINGIPVTEANKYDFNPGRYNTIEFNDVSRANLDTQDTGVYKSGGVYKNTINNNIFHDSGKFGGQKGLYLDDVSDFNTVTNNIVYGITSTGSSLDYNIKGTGNIVTNNIADMTGGSDGFDFNIISQQPTKNNHLTYNIFYQGSVYYHFFSYRSTMVAESDYNTFYRPSGTRVFKGIPGADTLTHWKTLYNNKYDQHSITSDPQFVDAANHDYTLKSTSPSLALGFNQIDVSEVGLTDDFLYELPTEDPGDDPEDPGEDPGEDPAVLFYEDFEEGFEAWSANFGTPTASTNQAHGGTYSYAPDQDQDEIYHDMEESTNAIVTVWFYDNASDNSMKVKARVQNSQSGANAQIGVTTATSTSKYTYQVNGSTFVASGVSRSTGWHELTFDLTSGTNCVLSIDGVQIAATTNISAFDLIYLGDNAADSKQGNVYFDDVEVVQLP